MNLNDNKSTLEQGKAGRPSKYEPETVKQILEALADGLTHKQACIAAGIGQSTLADWRERYPDLQIQMDEAREQARRQALAAIKAAGEKDWRAKAEWLKLTFPEYRQASTKVEVKTQAQAGEVRVLCDEATRHAMIEAREKFLRERPKETEQQKLQLGKPIGRTEVPGEEASDSNGQVVWQPGGTSRRFSSRT